MADAQRTVKLHVATTSDDGALTKTAATLRGVDAAADGVTASMAHASREALKLDGAMTAVGAASGKAHLNHGRLATETDRATKSTSQFGQSMLTAAYFADDMQYGLKGVMNNIPMLAMSLGMGSGVAGIVSILAVGFSVLSDQMGWFAEEAKSTTGDLKALARETRDAAAAATSEAQQTDLAEAALKRHNETLRASVAQQKEMVEAIEAGARAREAEARNILAETDAESALQLARVEKMRVDGVFNGQEAEAASLGIKKWAQEKAFAVEQENALRKQMELEEKARALEAGGNVRDSRASDLGATGGGLLDAEGRKAAEARMKQAGARLKEAEALAVATPEMMTVMRQAYGQQGASAEIVKNPAYGVAQRRLADAAKARSLAAGVLDRDTEARGRTGFGDADALRAEVEKLQREANEARREAARLRGDASLIMGDRESKGRVFSRDQERQEIETGTRVAGFNQRDAMAEAKRRAAEGQDVLSGAKGLKDVPAAAMTALAAAITAAENGAGGSEKNLSLLLKQMTEFMKRTKQQNATLEKDMAELRSQMAESRVGR